MARMVHCIKLGREAEGLAAPPYPGELGQRIFERVSKPAWQEWLEHQKRLINEYRLQLVDPNARKFLVTEMEKYFFGGGELTGTHYVPEDPASGGGTDSQGP
jgi:Fe-S cluster biosynthesis and repair protein YggX